MRLTSGCRRPRSGPGLDDGLSQGGAAVTEFVALFRLPERGSPLTRAGVDVIQPEPWRLIETGRSTASLGGSNVVVNTATIARGGIQRYVWWF